MRTCDIKTNGNWKYFHNMVNMSNWFTPEKIKTIQKDDTAEMQPLPLWLKTYPSKCSLHLSCQYTVIATNHFVCPESFYLTNVQISKTTKLRTSKLLDNFTDNENQNVI